jgi:hypothetical protein
MEEARRLGVRDCNAVLASASYRRASYSLPVGLDRIFFISTPCYVSNEFSGNLASILREETSQALNSGRSFGALPN